MANAGNNINKMENRITDMQGSFYALGKFFNIS